MPVFSSYSTHKKLQVELLTSGCWRETMFSVMTMGEKCYFWSGSVCCHSKTVWPDFLVHWMLQFQCLRFGFLIDQDVVGMSVPWMSCFSVHSICSAPSSNISNWSSQRRIQSSEWISSCFRAPDECSESGWWNCWLVCWWSGLSASLLWQLQQGCWMVSLSVWIGRVGNAARIQLARCTAKLKFKQATIFRQMMLQRTSDFRGSNSPVLSSPKSTETKTFVALLI